MLAKMLFQSGRDQSPSCRRGIELCDQLLAKSQSTNNRVMKMKLVALSGQVEEATRLADELAGTTQECLHVLVRGHRVRFGLGTLR